MTTTEPEVVGRWRDAECVAACLAVDRSSLGGVRLRAGPGPVRDAWIAMWRGLVDDDAPIRTIPLSIDDGRLLGGLDLAATCAPAARSRRAACSTRLAAAMSC